MTTALVPTSFAELMQMAEVISGAEGLVPRHCRSPRHAAVLMMRGAALGVWLSRAVYEALTLTSRASVSPAN